MVPTSAPDSHDEATPRIEMRPERVHLVALDVVVATDDVQRTAEAAAFELRRVRLEDQPTAGLGAFVATCEVLVERLTRVAVVGVVVRERHDVVELLVG